MLISNLETNPEVFEVAFLKVKNQQSAVRYVLNSKAPSCVREYGQSYYLVTCQDNAIEAGLFEVKVPTSRRLDSCLAFLRNEGIMVHYGRWLSDGYPQGLWFDLSSSKCNFAAIREEFYRLTEIWVQVHEDVSNMEDVLVYGHMIARFFTEYNHRARPDDSVAEAHFHQWQSAVGLILCRKLNLRLATVFTVYFTTLGKKLSEIYPDFFENLSHFVPLREAESHNLLSVHKIERLAIKLTHVLTTLSELISKETAHMAGRGADMILPVGVRPSPIPAHQYEIMHQQNKKKICDFLSGHFYGKREAVMNSDDMLLIVTAGEYEFHNKGFNLFIDAVSRLNQILKSEKSPLTVVALMLVPLNYGSVNVPSLHGQAISKGLKKTIKEIETAVGQRIFEAALKGELIPKDKLFTQAEMVRLKSQILNSKRKESPPIVTHNIHDSDSDPMLQQLRYLNLVNNDDDRVKVLVVPDTEEVFDFDMVETIRACNLAVFPSSYEPWGHLQTQALNLGVPIVTSNLSGFGSFFERNLSQIASGYGVQVVDRRTKSESQVIDELVQIMHTTCAQTPRERVIERTRAERMGHLFSWPRQYKKYVQARNLALVQAFPDEFEKDDDLF